MNHPIIQTIRVHTVNIPAKAVHSHGSGDVGGIHSVILEVVTVIVALPVGVKRLHGPFLPAQQKVVPPHCMYIYAHISSDKTRFKLKNT